MLTEHSLLRCLRVRKLLVDQMRRKAFFLSTRHSFVFQMNLLARGIWLILSVLFGAALSTILFFWVACDMHVPLIVTGFLAKYLPILTPLFRAPYVHIDALSSSIAGKLAFDAFLVATFGFCHTFFAQESVQASLSRSLFPKQTLRTAYCIMVSVNSFFIIGFWQHTNIQLWNWLPSTMSIHEQEIILMILYSIIFAPGNLAVERNGWRQMLFFRLLCPFEI